MRDDAKSREAPYLTVKSRIRSMILAGEFRVHDKLPGEPELAAQFGVSRMTANRALLALVDEGWLVRSKGRGTFVARDVEVPPLRRVAIAAPSDLGYIREDFYFGTLFWALHEAFGEQGLHPDFVRLDRMAPGERLYDGIIVINPAEAALEGLRRLAEGGTRVVLLGARWEGRGLDCIDSDNVLGAQLAVHHLLDHGHRNILFLGAFPETADTMDRARGFELALKSRGIVPREDQIVMVPMTLALAGDVRHGLAERFREASGPTAVFAAGSSLAFEVLSLAQSLGVSVPGDLSLVGYDDPRFLRMAHPAITTVAQPLAKMARAAAHRLLTTIEEADARRVVVLLDPTLIPRQSVAEPIPNATRHL